MTQLWNQLFVENPMLVEIQRFRRRFMRSGGAASNVLLGLAVVCYAGLFALIMGVLGDFSPLVLVGIQLFLYCLMAPTMLYQAIAGERERRSWDLLMAAPITKAQIVVGKFMGALSAIGAVGILFLIPILLTALTYRQAGQGLYNSLLAEAVCVSFTLMVSAFTILMSARVRRPFMALGSVIGVMALFLIVIPSVGSLLAGGDQTLTSFLLYMHPFFVVGQIGGPSGLSGLGQINTTLYGWPQILTYLIGTGVMLVWAERTLTFAENDVKFLPKGHQNA